MPFMPTDKPPYLAFAAHRAKSTKGMSFAGRRAHFKEAVRLENMYLASMPKWKRAVATFAFPPLWVIVIWAVILWSIIFGAATLYYLFFSPS